jgi:hypothetical protein
VVEETSDRSSRRGPRVERLLEEVVAMAASAGILVRGVAPWQRYVHFARQGARSKKTVNELLCARFPELKIRRPPCDGRG